jgi:16S rRNA processing protein RimM
MFPLEEGEFSSHQIRGLSVVTKEGKKLGLIKDIMPAGGSEILIMEYKGREVLIPFVQKICREIDLEEKRIIIDPPKGLLDLNEI